MSKASRNEQKRIYRKKLLEKKHFTEPLPEFLQAKYPTIYKEYEDLYKTVTEQHGKKRIVTKTETFKAWKASVEQPDNDKRTNTIGTQTSTETPSAPDIEQTEAASTTAVERQVEVIMPVRHNEVSETIQLNLDQLADIMVNVEGRSTT